MTNEELLQKAAIIAENLANGGKLTEQQADTFIDYLVDEATITKSARVVRIPKGDSFTINKIGVGKRVAVPVEEAKDPGVRRGVSTSKVVISAREVMVPFEIGDEFKRLNVEGASIEDRIVRMMAKQAANDTEEQGILGDPVGPAIVEADYTDGGDASRYRVDSFLAMQKGYLRCADEGNIVNAAGANIGASLFRQAITALPTKFRRDRTRLRWYMPADVIELWREKVSTRGTAAGDAALGGGDVLKPFGIEAVSVPMMPFEPKVVEHVTLNGTTAVGLRYAPVSDVVVTPATLGINPVAAYVKDTDYEIDEANGTIKRKGSGIGDGATVKVTYLSSPQILLASADNLIFAVSKDISIEKARDIYRGVNQYAIRLTMGFAIEEPTALVKVKNLGTGI